MSHPHYDDITGKWTNPDSEAAYAEGYKNGVKWGEAGSEYRARIRVLEQRIDAMRSCMREAIAVAEGRASSDPRL